jgi:hypothetical protein
MGTAPAATPSWKWCALVAAAMIALSLVPQIQLLFARGREWNGAYASLQGDEYLYSAYINALIDGRPRRNDPFAGRDAVAGSSLPESTFSIQFIPAYAIALPARAFGISASTAFILLTPIAALLTTASIFWLLFSITGDTKCAAVGVLFILCFGAVAGDQGLLAVLLNEKRSFFVPFLRRYQPVVAFPLFFVLPTLIWRALTRPAIQVARLNSILTGIAFGVLVFSYLYLWTSAAAWLACLAVSWILLRPAQGRRHDLEVFGIILFLAVLSLIPYLYLVSHRATSLDQAQALALSHRPDLFRIPELIGAFILLALVVNIRRKKIARDDPRVIFAASFGLLPLVLFNQQILSGKSIQPFHFEAFTANYGALVGLVILSSLVWRTSARTLRWIAIASLVVGTLEVSIPGWARTRVGIMEDQMVPVLKRLNALSREDGTLNNLRTSGKTEGVVFSPHPEVMGLLPTWAPQGTLLGAAALDFGTESAHERRELLYLQMYYSQVDAERFRDFLREKSDDTYMNFYAPSVIFGDERFLELVSKHAKPIEESEIEHEVQEYQAYLNVVSPEQLMSHPLKYLILRSDANQNLFALDRQYERDAGEQIGGYVLFSLKPLQR